MWTWHGTGEAGWSVVGRHNYTRWFIFAPTTKVQNYSRLIMKLALVIGLPGKPRNADAFIQRSVTFIDVNVCLFSVCIQFVYTKPLFIVLVVLPKKWA